MNLNQININQIIGQIQSLAIMIVGFIIALLLFSTSLKAIGHAIPYVPAMDPTPLAYLCGAFYLYRK